MSNSIGKFTDLTNIERCVLVGESARITAKSFKVHIPRLMPLQSSSGAVTENVNPNKALFASPYKGDLTFSVSNHIVAKSMTDYRIHHWGQILETSGVEHTTDDAIVPPHPVPHPGHEPHNHTCSKPIKIFDVKYEELNNKTISAGHEMVGVFVSGDIRDFRIIHIEGVIPQDGDEDDK